MLIELEAEVTIEIFFFGTSRLLTELFLGSVNNIFFGILGICLIDFGEAFAKTSGDTKSSFFFSVVVCRWDLV